MTNAKHRRGRVQLIDAREQWGKMPTSLGAKRKRIPDGAIAEITRWYADFAETETSTVFDNEAFGFRRDRRPGVRRGGREYLAQRVNARFNDPVQTLPGAGMTR